MCAHTYSGNSTDPKALQSTNKGHLEKENWNNPAENQKEIKKAIFWRSWDRPSGRKPKTLQKTKKTKKNKKKQYFKPLDKNLQKTKKTKKKQKKQFSRGLGLWGVFRKSSEILFFLVFLFFFVFLVFSRSWNLGWLKKSSEILFFLFFLVFSRSWHLGWLKKEFWNSFFCFLQVFCFLRACPRTSRILFSLFLCWFSAGFLKIVISLCFLSCPWLSPKIPNLFFICFTPGSGVWQEKTTSTFPLPFYWNLHFSLLFSIEFPTFLFSFLLNSLRMLYLSIEISAFCALFYWNLCFLYIIVYWNLYFSYTFILKSQLFPSLFYWIPYFLCTCWLESLLTLYFSIESFAFFALFYWNLCFPYLSIEISTFPPLFYWNLNFSLLFSIEFPTFLFSFLLNSLLTLYLSIEISTYPLLFYYSTTKSLLSLHFSFEISTFFTCLLKSLLFLYFSVDLNFSLLFSIEFPTVSLLVYWNPYFLFTFLLKSILSLY